jgi:sugar lactone lactonase YvrE
VALLPSAGLSAGCGAKPSAGAASGGAAAAKAAVPPAAAERVRKTPRRTAPVQPGAGPVRVEPGFDSPESVVHDAAADVLLVSNVVGDPGAKDDAAFISRLTATGELLALRWIDAADPAVELHAPKGLALAGDVLFVADLDVVRRFDRSSGAPLGALAVPGAVALNDVVVDGEALLVTDTGRGAEPGVAAVPGAVWRVPLAADGGAPTAIARGDELGGPNGILIDDGAVVIAAWTSGEVYRLDPATGARSDVVAIPGGQLDGLVRVGPGEVVVASWGAKALLRGRLGGVFAAIAMGLEGPADIALDASGKRLLIPLFEANALLLQPRDE